MEQTQLLSEAFFLCLPYLCLLAHSVNDAGNQVSFTSAHKQKSLKNPCQFWTKWIMGNASESKSWKQQIKGKVQL